MINLIKNEFKKLFAKKSTYIIILILIVLMIGIGALKKYSQTKIEEMMSSSTIYYEDIDSLEKRLEEIERSNFIGIYNTDDEWVYAKTTIEIDKLRNELKENKENEWKLRIIANQSHLIIPSLNEKIQFELQSVKKKDNRILKSDEYVKVANAYSKEVEAFKKITETEFTNLTITQNNKDIKEANKKITELKKDEARDKTINHGTNIRNLEADIKRYEHNIEVANIRLDKNIPYDEKNFMNRALDQYDSLKQQIEYQKSPTESTTMMERKDYYSMVSSLNVNKYVLDNEQDVNSPMTGLNNMKSFFNEYLDMYLILLIVIAGTIVAEEFSKGTIKNLLVKPYKRSIILKSKLIVVLLMSILFFLIMLVTQFVISGVLFDFNTMSDPVVEYNVVKETIVETNLYVYILKHFVYTFPYILVIILFSFALSTITTSVGAAITLGVMASGGTAIVNQILSFLEVQWVKYIPTLSWNWSTYLAPEYHPSYSISFTYAVLITVATWFIFVIPTYVVFKKRDIKNI